MKKEKWEGVMMKKGSPFEPFFKRPPEKDYITETKAHYLSDELTEEEKKWAKEKLGKGSKGK